MKKTIHLIAAARPNFMKIAPLYHALKKTDWVEPLIVHTGQHYDLNRRSIASSPTRLPTSSGLRRRTETRTFCGRGLRRRRSSGSETS